MLSYAVDIGRGGQYLRTGEWLRQAVTGPSRDLRFVDQVRRGFLPLPTDRPNADLDPFPAFKDRDVQGLAERWVAVIATGGSEALASMVGVVRVLEEAGVTSVA